MRIQLSPEYSVVRKFNWFTEKKVYKHFFETLYKIKDFKKEPLPFIVNENQMPNELSKLAIEPANAFIEFYNNIGIRDILQEQTIYKKTREFIFKLSRYEGYMNSPVHIYGVLGDHAENLYPNNNLAKKRFVGIAMLMLYMPIQQIQIQKQKLITGFYTLTQKPIFNTIRVMYPTFTYLAQSERSETPPLGTTQEEIIAALTHDFLFPLSDICRMFSEKDQDLLPEIWSHPAFMENRNIPDIGGKWEDYIDEGMNNRRFVIPNEGVLIDCTGYGDIKAISLKEKFGGWCYAKVSFSDNTDDILLFSIKDVYHCISSSYGNLYGAENDLVLKIVSKAYRDLISARRIVYRNPTKNKKRETQSDPSSIVSKQKITTSFVYIPRTYYVGQSVSNVRQPINKSSRNPHGVVGHLRKAKPTEEAIREARKYGIELPDGYTFVKPHHRGEKSIPEKQVVKFRAIHFEEEK